MTSSFTSMMLTALLVFDPTEFAVKAERFEVVSSLARKILDNAEDVKELVDLDFNRVIYLGAGPFLVLLMKLSSRFGIDSWPSGDYV